MQKYEKLSPPPCTHAIGNHEGIYETLHQLSTAIVRLNTQHHILQYWGEGELLSADSITLEVSYQEKFTLIKHPLERTTPTDYFKDSYIMRKYTADLKASLSQVLKPLAAGVNLFFKPFEFNKNNEPALADSQAVMRKLWPKRYFEGYVTRGYVRCSREADNSPPTHEEILYHLEARCALYLVELLKHQSLTAKVLKSYRASYDRLRDGA
jgi:hypothetical protein